MPASAMFNHHEASNENLTLTESLRASIALTACRQQPTLMFVDGGTLCARCGRQVAVACERDWLNDAWAENLEPTDNGAARMAAAARED